MCLYGDVVVRSSVAKVGRRRWWLKSKGGEIKAVLQRCFLSHLPLSTLLSVGMARAPNQLWSLMDAACMHCFSESSVRTNHS